MKSGVMLQTDDNRLFMFCSLGVVGPVDAGGLIVGAVVALVQHEGVKLALLSRSVVHQSHVLLRNNKLPERHKHITASILFHLRFHFSSKNGSHFLFLAPHMWGFTAFLCLHDSKLNIFGFCSLSSSMRGSHLPSGEKRMLLTGLWKWKWWRTARVMRLTNNAAPSVTQTQKHIWVFVVCLFIHISGTSYLHPPRLLSSHQERGPHMWCFWWWRRVKSQRCCWRTEKEK